MDFETRRKDFLEAYGKLTQEYKCDFLSTPVYMPTNDGRSWALIIETKIMDTTEQPVESPFSL